ncbi:hypothetical protein [Chryseobacterium sp. 18068]|uniref:hypothetical protein n=1 Tax=Chryseobacterium sp. 18068 TaxID=2681414 RepID=UPI001E61B5F1|nr:hypothetical protein [Chryseobacterium sp. 18068]
MGGMFHGGTALGGFADNRVKSIMTRSGHKVVFTEDESIIITDKSGNEIHLDTTGSNINITAPETMTLNCKNMNKTVNATDYNTITEFDGKGFPKKSEKKSIYGFYVNEVEYDQKGNPSKEINYDLLFKFKAKDILNYMKNNDFNLDKKYYQNILSSEVPPPTILRGTADEFKLLIPELKLNHEFVWIISNVEGKYKGNNGIYLICLDGNTGKELLVKKIFRKKIW